MRGLEAEVLAHAVTYRQMNLGELFKLSEPQIHHLHNGENIFMAYCHGAVLWWEPNKYWICKFFADMRALGVLGKQITKDTLPSRTSDSVDQRWTQSLMQWFSVLSEHETHLGSSWTIQIPQATCRLIKSEFLGCRHRHFYRALQGLLIHTKVDNQQLSEIHATVNG